MCACYAVQASYQVCVPLFQQWGLRVDLLGLSLLMYTVQVLLVLSLAVPSAALGE